MDLNPGECQSSCKRGILLTLSGSLMWSCVRKCSKPSGPFARLDVAEVEDVQAVIEYVAQYSKPSGSVQWLMTTSVKSASEAWTRYLFGRKERGVEASTC